VSPADPFALGIVQWELTRRCDLSCGLCFLGEHRAGHDELSTGQALDLIEQCAELDVKQIHLFGGEAYLRSDFLQIVRAIADRGIRLTFTTGGYRFPVEDVVQAAGDLISLFVFSIDGLESVHDMLRGRAGSFAAVMRSLEKALHYGIDCGVSTQLNRRTLGNLGSLAQLLFLLELRLWHIQLTEPFGRAATKLDDLLQPYELPRAFDVLCGIKQKSRRYSVVVKPGNNIGYFTGRTLKLRQDLGPFGGCRQGLAYLAVQSDGIVKGCAGCARGIGTKVRNIKNTTLAEIWSEADVFAWTRYPERNLPWGFCAECPYRDPCRGGCVQTSQALFGRPGNNPYCDYRVSCLAEEGRRERIVAAGAGAESPFRVIEEPMPVVEAKCRSG